MKLKFQLNILLRGKSQLTMLLGLFVFLCINIPAQVMPTSKILLNFSEPMDRENIFDPANYIVTANNNISVTVIKVGLVEGDSSVVLFIDKDAEWRSFQITVHNLKDKAGNLINAEKNVADINTMLIKNTPVMALDAK